MKNNYLSKWLNAELSDDELKTFIGDSEFKAYQKIKYGINKFEAPNFDSKAILNSIQAKTINKKPKLLSLVPNWAYSAAASVVLLLAAYLFFFTNINLTTDYGEQYAFNLKDGSYVKLNAKSTLSYNKFFWSKNRTVNLNGEAYFEVVHGSTFSVNTPVGNIKVLGTHFDVKTGTDYLKVTCFEGKVTITTNNIKTILTKGQVYQFSKNKDFKWNINLTKPSWVDGIYTYRNTPLFIIIRDLENHFNINFDKNNNIDRNILLNASFENNNRDLALKAIFVPLNFNFFIKNNIVILTKK